MKQRNKFLALLGGIALLAAIYYFATTDRSTDMQLVGVVDANQVVVSARVAGRIEQLLVEDGTRVKAGDTIALLDTSELAAQARAAKASITSLGARIGEAQATEQQAVGQTASDVQTAQAKAQAARSQLVEAQADLERTRSDTQRTVALAEQGVASRQLRDQAEATLKAAQARVQSLQDQVRAADSDVAAARARTHQANAAQSNVAATRGQLEQAQAQLAEAETRLGYTKVVAPVTGAVSVRAARTGEVVQPGQPIVTIVDLNDTWVRAAVAETYADRIQLGDTLNVRLPSGRVISGKVTFKGVEADFATQRDVSRSKRDIRTVALKVAIANPEGAFTPGMTATVLLPQAKLDGTTQAAQGAPR